MVAVDDDAGAGEAGGRRLRRQEKVYLALELTLRALVLAAGDGANGWEKVCACVNARWLEMVRMGDGVLRVGC